MIELSSHQQQFVDSQIATGMFSEPGEVVAVALDLLEQRQKEYEQLRTAIEQDERGEVEPLDMEDIKRRGRERMGRV
jgi:putative addiction module CopG family antidote